MTEEKEFSRGDTDSRAESLKAQVEARIAAAAEQKAAEAAAELGEAPPPEFWDIFALGPFQDPTLAQPPGRIIELDEEAFIVTIVFLNTAMDTNISDYGARVQLNYFTSNTQTMEPVSAMDYSCCFEPDDVDGVVTPFGTFYVTIWTFTPTEAACILETNICARICNCEDEVVPGRAAFVRWVFGIDFDAFFPPVPLTFDHPIRYLVYDNDDNTNCDCPEDCEPLP